MGAAILFFRPHLTHVQERREPETVPRDFNRMCLPLQSAKFIELAITRNET